MTDEVKMVVKKMVEVVEEFNIFLEKGADGTVMVRSQHGDYYNMTELILNKDGTMSLPQHPGNFKFIENKK